MSKSQEEKHLQLFQETLDALADIIVVVNVSDFFKIEETDTAGLLVSEAIRISDNYLILPGSLYILGEEPPYNIFTTGFNKEKGNGYISLEPTQVYDDEHKELTLYSLINYIYKYYDLNEEQRGIIERNFIKSGISTLKKGKKVKTTDTLTIAPLKLKSSINIMNDKLTNVVPEKIPQLIENENGQMSFTWLIDPKTKKESQIGLTLVMPENFVTTRPIDFYDYRVMEAIAEIVETGARAFTPPQIYEAMTGVKDPGKQQLDELKNHIDKLRMTLGEIDLTHGNENISVNYNGEIYTQVKFRDNLLHLQEVVLIAPNGKRTSGYTIIKDILLVAYNQGIGKNGRLLHFPRVDIKGLPYKSDVIMIKRYLDQRIQGMRAGKLNSDMIYYDTICVASGLGRPEDRLAKQEGQSEKAFQSQIRKKRQKDRDKIEIILQTYSENGIIEKWEAIKTGGHFKGYNITVNKESK